MRSLSTSEISTLPQCYLKLLNWSGKNLLEGMVPLVSSLPGEHVFNIVIDQDAVSR